MRSKKVYLVLSVVLLILIVFGVEGVSAGHVNCGQTITESTILDSDLTCSGNGLIIGANNITLDCDWHTISGPAQGGFNGVQISNKQNVTIKNCNIQNYSEGTGIKVFQNPLNLIPTNHTFSNIISNYNVRGLEFSNSYNNTFTNLTANYNSIDGIKMSYPLGFTGTNNIFSNINFNYNGDCGLRLGDTDASFFYNVTANNNVNDGICFSRSTKNIFSGVTANYNGAGIYLIDDSHNNVFSDVNANNNNVSGFFFTGIAGSNNNNTILNANANYNGQNGFFLNGHFDTTIINATANYNGQNGLYVGSGFDGTYLNITANSNGQNGIYQVSSGSFSNTFSGITANYNSQNGLYVTGNLILSGINASYNGQYGIESYPAVAVLSNINTNYNTYGFRTGGQFNTFSIINANYNSLYGVYLFQAFNNNLSYINANSNNDSGIYFFLSSNNILTNTTATQNGQNGILLESSSSNLIYNNFFNNTINAKDSSGTNFWNTKKTAGTNIVGGPFIGGNFWHDYLGEDLDNDGIGDTLLPYKSNGNIANGGDFLPLVLFDSCPLDLSGNDIVGIEDLLELLANWGSPYGIVDLLDLLANWGPCPESAGAASAQPPSEIPREAREAIRDFDENLLREVRRKYSEIYGW